MFAHATDERTFGVDDCISVSKNALQVLHSAQCPKSTLRFSDKTHRPLKKGLREGKVVDKQLEDAGIAAVVLRHDKHMPIGVEERFIVFFYSG